MKRVREQGNRSQQTLGFFFHPDTISIIQDIKKHPGRPDALRWTFCSDIESEEYDITILYDIFLALQTELTSFTDMRL